MKALVLEHGRVELRERPEPVPARGEALVRVSMAGICNTDLELAKGYMGFQGVLGHELCGVVEACEDSSWLGRRVAGEINLPCRACELCRRGLTNHCPTRTVLGIVNKDGCFAEHVTLPLANLHALPDSLRDERACFVEPTAAAFRVLEQARVTTEDHVAVLGDGKLGLLVAQALRTTGCRLVLAGKHDRKLALARRWGLETARAGHLPRKHFDLVVEATGSPEGLHAAIELTRPRGKLVLKSTYHGALSLDAAPIVIDELELVGSRCGPFPVAIDALARGLVDVAPLVDAVLPLRDATKALERASAPGTLKVLLDMRP